MRRTTVTLAVAAVALFVAAGAALAGKPSSSLSLVVLPLGAPAGSSTTGAAAASYGGQITFDVSTNETAQPYVNVRCYQGGVFVYDNWGSFANGSQPSFTLSSNYWTGGAAACTARLVSWDKQGRQQDLATTSFQVAG
jgi:hypothetical protein